jgi:hypothetical protein
MVTAGGREQVGGVGRSPVGVEDHAGHRPATGHHRGADGRGGQLGVGMLIDGEPSDPSGEGQTEEQRSRRAQRVVTDTFDREHRDLGCDDRREPRRSSS